MSTFKLTAKQRQFCVLVVKGEAKPTAYEQAGYSVRSRTVASVQASKLLRNPNVQGYIAELQEGLANRTLVTLDSITRDLLDIRDAAKQDKSYGPAVAALVAVARLHGLMVDKAELTIEHRPAPLPTKVLELSRDDWIRQFGAESQKRLLDAAKLINRK